VLRRRDDLLRWRVETNDPPARHARMLRMWDASRRFT
jgi:hypothetical protein